MRKSPTCLGTWINGAILHVSFHNFCAAELCSLSYHQNMSRLRSSGPPDRSYLESFCHAWNINGTFSFSIHLKTHGSFSAFFLIKLIKPSKTKAMSWRARSPNGMLQPASLACIPLRILKWVPLFYFNSNSTEFLETSLFPCLLVIIFCFCIATEFFWIVRSGFHVERR